MTKTNPATQLIKEIAAIEKEAKKGLILCNSLADKLKQLQKQGVVYGTLHKRDGKYYYLLHRSKVGEKRIREYLGVDEKKISYYEACIERSIEYDEVQEQLQAFEKKANSAMHYLKMARFALV